MTYLLITMGGVVCVTESSEGCPDWPGCYGRLVPPPQTEAIIEYTHRVTALLTSPLIVAAAIVGWRDRCASRWVRWPPIVAIAFLLAVVVFGALAVLRGLSPGLAAVDLGSALVVLALLVTALVVAWSRHASPSLPGRLSFSTPFAQLALATLAAGFLVLVSGVLVAQGASFVRCLGWPLYGGSWAAVDSAPWVQMARRVGAVVTSLLILTLVVQAWRTQRRRPAVLGVATGLGLLLAAETAIGAILAARGLTVFLSVVYVALAAALWAFLVALAALAGLASSSSAQAQRQAQDPARRAA
jgi:heme A synthase